MAQLGSLLPQKEKIKSSFRVKEEAEIAAKLAPKDPTTQHFLGRWCFAVASIGWLERKAAALIFAKPPESTYEEALKFFLAADALEDNFKRNAMWVGDTYKALGKKVEAVEWYKTAVDMPFAEVVRICFACSLL